MVYIVSYLHTLSLGEPFLSFRTGCGGGGGGGGWSADGMGWDGMRGLFNVRGK